MACSEPHLVKWVLLSWSLAVCFLSLVASPTQLISYITQSNHLAPGLQRHPTAIAFHQPSAVSPRYPFLAPPQPMQLSDRSNAKIPDANQVLRTSLEVAVTAGALAVLSFIGAVVSHSLTNRSPLCSMMAMSADPGDDALNTESEPNSRRRQSIRKWDDAPWGYQALAFAALLVNACTAPVLFGWLRYDMHFRAANLVVGTLAILISCITGIAGIGLLSQRYWGVILSIVSLSLSLGLGVGYGAARLIWVPHGRLSFAILFLIGVAINTLALVYWCLPMHKRFLKDRSRS